MLSVVKMEVFLVPLCLGGGNGLLDGGTGEEYDIGMLNALRLRSAFLYVACLWACSALGGNSGLSAELQHKATRIRAAGDPTEVGKRIGKRVAGPLRLLQPAILQIATLTSRKSKAELYAVAKQLSAKLAKEDIAEIRGLAKGSGLEFEDALFISMFYSIVYDGPACRQLAVWGKSSSDGELMHARNLDWMDYPGELLRRTNLIINVAPRKGNEYVFLTWPGFQGVLTGSNNKGITLGFNRINSRKFRLAEPVVFTLKRILRECDNLDDAVTMLKKARPLGNGSVLISDAGKKKALVVELYEGDVGVRRPNAKEQMIGNANHYVAAAWKKLPAGMPSGRASWPTCHEAAKQGKGLTSDKVKAVMASYAVLQNINIVSVIFKPKANKMLLSCGRLRAAKGTFTEYELFPKPKQK